MNKPKSKYEFSYIRNANQERKPQLLSININENTYFFQLETFHLNQYVYGIKSYPKCHIHKVYHIVQYSTDSPITNLQIQDKHVSVNPGSIVMLPPDVPHVFQPSGTDACYNEITFSLVDISGKPLSNCGFSSLFELWSGQEYNEVDYAFSPSESLHHTMLRHYQKISNQLQNSGNDIFPALSAITGMMFSLMGHMTGIEVNADPRLTRAKTYIENNYLKALSLKDIARHVGMSPEHFCKRFKKEFDLAPLEFRQNLRMNAADQLLSLSELQITEIADRLGFSDIYSFSRAFKNHNGISPIQKRKLLT